MTSKSRNSAAGHLNVPAPAPREEKGDKQAPRGNTGPHYTFLGLRAAKALALPLWRKCLYLGWDKNRLVTVLESVYDDMGDIRGPVLALKPRCATVPPGVFLPID
jgi:hypothetical protein